MTWKNRTLEYVVYPTFRQEIDELLVEKHCVDPELAEAFLSHPAVVRKMETNPLWTYAMGPEFWAAEIAEILSIAEKEEQEGEEAEND